MYTFTYTLYCFSDEFWKALNVFSMIFFQVERKLPGILNWFATSLLCLPFSRSFNSSYFTFKVTSWCFVFVTIFIVSATNNRIQTKLKISKHSNIMAFELKHLNLPQQNIEEWKTKLRNQNSNYMIKNTSRGPKNVFNLDDLSNNRSSNYMISTVYSKFYHWIK